jgi:exosome complex component RRP41
MKIRRLQEMGLVIKETFQQIIQTELYPRSEIDINIQILQAEGGVLHAALNAATLAIIDAGISVRDYVCACSAGCVEETPILDLNNFEEQAQFDLPKFTVAVLPRSGSVISLHLESRMHLSRFQLVRELAVLGARQIYSVLDKAVRDNGRNLLENMRDANIQGES